VHGLDSVLQLQGLPDKLGTQRPQVEEKGQQTRRD
jgi:hypothetical protein